MSIALTKPANQLPATKFQRFILRAMTGIDLQSETFAEYHQNVSNLTKSADNLVRIANRMGNEIKAMHRELDTAMQTSEPAEHI